MRKEVGKSAEDVRRILVSKKTMKLIFRDRTTFEGESFGAEANVAGEVVFNTAMTGYVETLTDPSYCGQILVVAYPLVGNYGVPNGPFESERIQITGLVVAHYSENPSHYTQQRSLGEWCKSQGIPAVCGVDTRSLTRYLREFGTSNGKLLIDDEMKATNVTMLAPADYLKIVAPKITLRYGSWDTKILMVDTGGKENIVRSLINRQASVIRTPWNSDWEKFLPEVDGVFFPNGPGDPMDALSLIEQIRHLLNSDMPIFGICLGNQLLALASGAKTVKMKYGHRSINQPVRDLSTGRCYISSQNHGYVVHTQSLQEGWNPWFVNINDQTNEGIRHIHKPIFSVQFHPEACPGPHDAAFLFDEYINVVRRLKHVTKPSMEIDRLPEVHTI
ncbi:Carbamoyl-phosphate synthase small chain [Gammaproteobacteria bacterium]